MYRQEYEAKRIAVEQAVSMLRPGDMVLVGNYGNEPIHFLHNIHRAPLGADRAELCAGTLSRDYPFMRDEGCGANIHTISYFLSPEQRIMRRAGKACYIPTDLHSAASCLMHRQVPRICVVAVSPMDEEGFFYISTSLLLVYEIMDEADILIFEVNSRLPRVYGETRVHISRVDYLYEAESELREVPIYNYDHLDYTIADYAASLIKDGDTIQLGVGGAPGCVASALYSRHDLGVHTEFFGTEMGQLMQRGVINNSKKNLHPGKSICAFTGGNKAHFEYIDRHPDIEIHPAIYVNDPSVVSLNDNMVSVNTALEIDLTGQVCSESIGSLQYSGTGGATDFASGAFYSKGGRGVIAIHSTAKGGSISKIKFQLSPGAAVSISRNITDYIVTEYGIAKMRGASLRERAKQLIAIAHPDFREELTRQARELLLW